MGSELDDTRTGGPGRRRSPRILARVLLRIEHGDRTTFEANTAVINRHGALLLSRHRLESGSSVQITNLEHGFSRTFEVVRCEDESDGLYKIGVEMPDAGADFWGPAYRPEADT